MLLMLMVLAEFVEAQAQAHTCNKVLREALQAS
jgi:hypothetical protein